MIQNNSNNGMAPDSQGCLQHSEKVHMNEKWCNALAHPHLLTQRKGCIHLY